MVLPSSVSLTCEKIVPKKDPNLPKMTAQNVHIDTNTVLIAADPGLDTMLSCYIQPLAADGFTIPLGSKKEGRLRAKQQRRKNRRAL